MFNLKQTEASDGDVEKREVFDAKPGQRFLLIDGEDNCLDVPASPSGAHSEAPGPQEVQSFVLLLLL
ncbi:unnamed protein product [Lota lota]